MTKEARNPNDELLPMTARFGADFCAAPGQAATGFVLRASSFFRHLSFVIRQSSVSQVEPFPGTKSAQSHPLPSHALH
jgi:hypothetical protein